jgi:hypothetical protein
MHTPRFRNPSPFWIEVRCSSYERQLVNLAHPGPVARCLKTPISSRPSIITPSPPPILNFTRNFTRTSSTLFASEHQVDISLTPTPDRKEVTHSLRKDRCSVANASPTSSSHRDVPIRPPHRSLPHPRKLPRLLLEPATIDSPPDGSVQLRKGRRRRPSLRRSFSPVPRLEYDLPTGFGERVLRSRPSPLCADVFSIGAVPGSGFTTCTTPKRQAIGIDDFAYLIPLDCKTSTPVAARRRTLASGKASPASERYTWSSGG